MGNGKIIYPSGDPDAITYTFAQNYDYGPDIGAIESHDMQRGFDGTLNSFAGHNKMFWELQFTRAPKTQFDLFMQLYRFHVTVDFYLDGDSPGPDAVVYLVTAPSGKPEAAFTSPGVPAWTFSIRFEEV